MDDEILLGSQVIDKRARDSDGDGVSDDEEALAGTDPHAAGPELKPLEVLDPRDDLQRPDLEREVGFDPASTMPAGKSITSALDGLTNLDGSALSAGPNHLGVGLDAMSGQHGGSGSPLDVQRDPTGMASGTAGTFPGRANNMDLVSSKGGGSSRDTTFKLGADDLAATEAAMDAARDQDKADRANDEARRAAREAKSDGSPPSAARQAQQDADAAQAKADKAAADTEAAQAAADAAAKALADAKAKADGGNVNPDAEEFAPTAEQIDLAIVRAGGDSTPVRGQGEGPTLDADEVPVRYGDLVTDGGAESGDLGEAKDMQGRPDAPLVHTVNPDSGYGPTPPIGGGPPGGGGGGQGGGGEDRFSGSAAATAASEPGAGSGVTNIGTGTGSGGIQTAGAEGIEAGEATAVEAFASEYLEESALEPMAPDLAEDLTVVEGQAELRYGEPPAEALEPLAPLEPDAELDDV